MIPRQKSLFAANYGDGGFATVSTRRRCPPCGVAAQISFSFERASLFSWMAASGTGVQITEAFQRATARGGARRSLRIGIAMPTLTEC